MPRYILGLDIGSNSVGSAWVDMERQQVQLAASVFPAGVDESDDSKRGAPKNQERRMARSLRRGLARRALRKHAMRKALVELGFLPADLPNFKQLLDHNRWPIPADAQPDPNYSAWHLRADALTRPLHPFEFGRLMLHLIQRRGAIGIGLTEDKEEGPVKEEGSVKEEGPVKNEGPVKEAIKKLKSDMLAVNSATFGQFMAKRFDASRRQGKSGNTWQDPIRNRRDDFQYHADRGTIRDEFSTIWVAQAQLGGPLAKLLTPDLMRRFDRPPGNNETVPMRQQGLLFGQRKTTWDLGRLGRCELEPTDRHVAKADMHAQHYRVIDWVSTVRIRENGGDYRALTAEQRDTLIAFLAEPQFAKPKSASPKPKKNKKGQPAAAEPDPAEPDADVFATGQSLPPGELPGKLKPEATVTDIRKALGFSPRDKHIELNCQNDADRGIHFDRFSAAIIHCVFTKPKWDALTPKLQEAVNKTLLRLDPEVDRHEGELRTLAAKYWGLDQASTNRLIQFWQTQPKLEDRLNLSRRAIINLLPYMQRFDASNNRWPSVIEARQMLAEDGEAIDRSSNTPISDSQRQRYSVTGERPMSKADRHFMAKHPDLLLPAPFMTNPVVRKAIHEVRRHIIAYMRRYGNIKPDRIVVEFARETTQAGTARDRQLNQNRNREKIRKQIESEIIAAAYGSQAHRLTSNQIRAAVDRVVLWQQQRKQCVYTGRPISAHDAAKGNDVEIDHILPYSRTGDNSLANKVLCARSANRDKANQTPAEWWGPKLPENIKFAERVLRDDPDDSGYFSPRDSKSKLDRFTREIKPGEDWSSSQLTDTAYAAKAVVQYLSDALYHGTGLAERGGERKIFVTKGKYTAMLRRQWQLFATLNRRIKPDEANPSDDAFNRSAAMKDRTDHRHHAIDALVIALTGPDIVPRLAASAAAEEEHFAKHGSREGFRSNFFDPPWGEGEGKHRVASFRRQILSRVFSEFQRSGALDDTDTEQGQPLVVCHRIVKRKIVGYLHKDTSYGPVFDHRTGHRVDDRTTNRIGAARLTANHLRMPDGWDASSARIRDPKTSGAERAALKATLAGLPDEAPGKSGIVRDRALRDTLRQCVINAGLDPDSLKPKQSEDLNAARKFVFPNGQPIKSVVLLRANNDPVVIRRTIPTGVAGIRAKSTADREDRIYDSQSNHHLEIRESDKGKWTGTIITTIEAASRNKDRLNARRAACKKLGLVPKASPRKHPELKEIFRQIDLACPIVDRSTNTDGRFVMSLAEGETVYMKHPDTAEPGFFVVFKLDKPQTIHFKHHWDSRRAMGTRDEAGKIIENSEREDIAVSATQLKVVALDATKLSLSPTQLQQSLSPNRFLKVRIDSLGQARHVCND